MKAHITSEERKTKSPLQKMYKNRIPIYRLNKPKISIKDIKNMSQRFTYNDKLHKFTQENEPTEQDRYDCELNINRTSTKVRLKKRLQIPTLMNNLISPSLQKNSFTQDQAKIRYSTKNSGRKKPSYKQSLLTTQFDVTFLKDYSKQKRCLKSSRNGRTIDNNQFSFQSNVKKQHWINAFSKFSKKETLINQNSSKLLKQMKQINLFNIKNQMQEKELKRLEKIYKQIQKFYQFVNALHKLEYNQQKIDQWVSNYILSQKRILKDIYLKQKGFNRASSTQIQYGIQTEATVKIKAKEFKRVINFKQVGVQMDDLKDLNIFIEDILIQKQYFQLKRMDDYIQDKTKLIQNNYENLKDQKSLQLKKVIDKYTKNKVINPMEYYQTFNFFDDIKRMQDLYGPIKGVTRSNRRIFQDLTVIQLNTHKK